MNVPSGYTALDLVGFTDRGPYDPNANYVKNDLVHDSSNKIWKCKIDDTTGITPAEGANWTVFVDSQTALSGMTDVNFTNPADGDVIVYDGTAHKWKNANTLKALKKAFDDLGLSVVDGTINQTYNS